MAQLPTSDVRESAPERPRRARGRRWKDLRRSLGLRAAGWVGPFALRRLCASWKKERLNSERWEAIGAGKQGVLLALWHGRMLCGMNDHSHRGYGVLVSHSRDGDIITRMLERFGYRMVRGSSRKGGSGAVRELVGELEQGSVIVITPDGPRGPRHELRPGLAWLARETGFPVLPMGFACDKAWRLKSWDRFTIPKFGARVVLSYGEPVRVARDANEAQLAEASRAIRASLIAAETLGFRHLGEEPDW